MRPAELAGEAVFMSDRGTPLTLTLGAVADTAQPIDGEGLVPLSDPYGADSDGVKHCLYCLRPFVGKARCCCLGHERKVAGRAAYITRSRREASARIMAAEQARHRHDADWRAAAVAADPLPHFAEIFGLDLGHLPAVRHGETLDL